MTFDPSKLHKLCEGVARHEEDANEAWAQYVRLHGEEILEFLGNAALTFPPEVRDQMMQIFHDIVKELRAEVAH